jgi:hypothetical protein
MLLFQYSWKKLERIQVTVYYHQKIMALKEIAITNKVKNSIKGNQLKNTWKVVMASII